MEYPVKIFLSAALLALPGLVHADHAPKPGPEVQKLAYYIGTWVGQGETQGGPFGVAGKLSSKQTCKWFSGGFQVICQGEEKGPTGTRTFLNILGYDSDSKTYTQHSISSRGESEDDKGGSLVGDKLTFLMDAGDGKTKINYTEVHVSPVKYTYQVEASSDGKLWTLVATGEIRKIK